MTTLETLKALGEAGDKATQKEWKTAPSGQDIPYIFAPDAVDDVGRIIARFDYSRKDRDFIILAANSREAIKSAIAEIEAKDKEIERLRGALERLRSASDMGENELLDNQIFKICDEALGGNDE